MPCTRTRGTLRGQAALMLCASALAAGTMTLAPAGASAAVVDRVERKTVRLINEARRQRGLRPLRLSRRLTTIATRQSVAMARRGLVAHGAWFGRISRAAGTRTVGEVLAWVRVRSSRQAAWTVRAWLRSPAHRAVILSRRFRRVGVGRRWRRPGGTTYFTLDTAR